MTSCVANEIVLFGDEEVDLFLIADVEGADSEFHLDFESDDSEFLPDEDELLLDHDLGKSVDVVNADFLQDPEFDVLIDAVLNDAPGAVATSESSDSSSVGGGSFGEVVDRSLHDMPADSLPGDRVNLSQLVNSLYIPDEIVQDAFDYAERSRTQSETSHPVVHFGSISSKVMRNYMEILLLPDAILWSIRKKCGGLVNIPRRFVFQLYLSVVPMNVNARLQFQSHREYSAVANGSVDVMLDTLCKTFGKEKVKYKTSSYLKRVVKCGLGTHAALVVGGMILRYCYCSVDGLYQGISNVRGLEDSWETFRAHSGWDHDSFSQCMIVANRPIGFKNLIYMFMVVHEGEETRRRELYVLLGRADIDSGTLLYEELVRRGSLKEPELEQFCLLYSGEGLRGLMCLDGQFLCIPRTWAETRDVIPLLVHFLDQQLRYWESKNVTQENPGRGRLGRETNSEMVNNPGTSDSTNEHSRDENNEQHANRESNEVGENSGRTGSENVSLHEQLQDNMNILSDDEMEIDDRGEEEHTRTGRVRFSDDTVDSYWTEYLQLVVMDDDDSGIEGNESQEADGDVAVCKRLLKSMLPLLGSNQEFNRKVRIHFNDLVREYLANNE